MTIPLLMKKFGLGLKIMEQISTGVDTEKLFKGAQEAIRQVIEKAKQTDRTLVISRDGKPVRVKARDL